MLADFCRGERLAGSWNARNSQHRCDARQQGQCALSIRIALLFFIIRRRGQLRRPRWPWVRPCLVLHATLLGRERKQRQRLQLFKRSRLIEIDCEDLGTTKGNASHKVPHSSKGVRQEPALEEVLWRRPKDPCRITPREKKKKTPVGLPLRPLFLKCWSKIFFDG